MPELLHCADLHLSRQEQEYGGAVLREILTHARSADALLLSGDTFDSYADLEALRPDFLAAVDELLGAPDTRRCRVLMLTGNHEHLRAPAAMAGKSPFSATAWPGIELLDATPFCRVPLLDGDIVAIPHAESYSDYAGWNIPPRSGSWRIVAAHAAVAGVHYLGPEDEENGSILDPDALRHCDADYAAMGHIHQHADTMIDGVRIVFPGSARVWRKHESGPRQLCRLQISESGSISANPVILQQAGVFRPLDVAVEPDGSCRLPESFDADAVSPKDWLHLDLSGVIENENVLADGRADLERTLPARRITFSEKQVTVVHGIRENPLAQRFEQNWQKRARTGVDREELLSRARLIALQAIYTALQDQT